MQLGACFGAIKSSPGQAPIISRQYASREGKGRTAKGEPQWVAGRYPSKREKEISCSGTRAVSRKLSEGERLVDSFRKEKIDSNLDEI